MASWRTLPTNTLVAKAEAAEEAGNYDLAEKYWEELEGREEQDAANNGAMNGVAPTP